MAEFQEVVKQWRRRCVACEKNERVKCYINGYVCEAFCKMQKHIDPEFVERDVMSWAAEHPEPEYPSVAKYLEQFGIIIRCDGTLQADFFKAHEPMSAYIAEKLGVEPKEG